MAVNRLFHCMIVQINISWNSVVERWANGGEKTEPTTDKDTKGQSKTQMSQNGCGDTGIEKQK